MKKALLLAIALGLGPWVTLRAQTPTTPDLIHVMVEADRIRIGAESMPRFAKLLPNSKIVGPGEVFELEADSTYAAIEVQDGGIVRINPANLATVLRVTHFYNLPGGLIDFRVACGRRFDLVFQNIPIDARDGFQWGNGLINFGQQVRIGCAMPKTWLQADGDLAAGATEIKLREAAIGWSVNDDLIIVDTKSPRRFTDAEGKAQMAPPRRERPVYITAISADRLTLTLSKPLDFEHNAIRDPDGQVRLHVDVANFSRNIDLWSEDESGTPGHTATVGHQASSNIQYNEFRGLGRTDAIPLDDTSARPVPTGRQKGRYADHWHHTQGFGGLSRGNSYRGHRRTKWGLALHRTSYAKVEWPVCADFVGACFVTEEGDEVGNSITDAFAAYVTGGAVNFHSPLANLGPQVNCPGCEGAALWVDGLVNGTYERIHLWNSNNGLMLIPAVKPGAMGPRTPGGALDMPLLFPNLVPSSIADVVVAGNSLSGLEYWGIGWMFPVTRLTAANNATQGVFGEVTVPNIRLVDPLVLCDTFDAVGLKIGKPYVSDLRVEGGEIRGCGHGIDGGGGNAHTLVSHTLFQNRQDVTVPHNLVTDGTFRLVSTRHRPMPGLPLRALTYGSDELWAPPASSSDAADLATCRHQLIDWNGTGLNHCLSAPRHRPARDPFNAASAYNGATATTSTLNSWGEPFDPRGAIDGDRLGTDWGFGPDYYWGGVFNIGAAATPDQPQWLAVDFGATRTIDRVSVYFQQDAYKTPAPPTAAMTCFRVCGRDFAIQVKQGDAWQTVASVSDNAKVIREFTFAPVSTTAVRLYVTLGGVGDPSIDVRPNGLAVAELEAHATSAIDPKVYDPATRIEDAFGHVFTLEGIEGGRGYVYRNGALTMGINVAVKIATCDGAAFMLPAPEFGGEWQRYQGKDAPRWAVAPFTCSGEPPPPPPPPPSDRDGDGIADGVDRCPDQAAPGTEDGCLPPPPPPDTDGDGVPDSRDDCPNTPAPGTPNGCVPPPPDSEALKQALQRIAELEAQAAAQAAQLQAQAGQIKAQQAAIDAAAAEAAKTAAFRKALQEFIGAK